MTINATFELEKLIKTFSYSKCKIIFLYNINYKDSINLYNTLASILFSNEKLPSWSTISNMDINDILLDINNVLLANLEDENLVKNKDNSLFKRKILIPAIKRKLIDFEHNVQARNDNRPSKSKVILPIMSTLSTLGIALGVPLFSTLLFRQSEIISGNNGSGALGVNFFYAMISLAIVFICSAVISMIITLYITIRQQRIDMAVNLLINAYNKLINKYFYLPNQNISQFEKKRKILLSKSFVFLYNNVSTKSNNYVNFLNATEILTKINCDVCLCMSESINPEIKKISKNSINEELLEYIDYSKYKTNLNTKLILNFILYQISIISGLSTRNLLSKNKKFTNSIYKFLDDSTTNGELLQLLYDFKNYIGFDSKTMISNFYVSYFIDLFTLIVFKTLDSNAFEKCCHQLINSLAFDNELNENYYFKVLNIKQLFNDNLIKYKNNSLFFMLGSFLNNEITLKKLINNVDKDTKKVESVTTQLATFKAKGFQPVEHDLPIVDYVFVKDETYIYYKIFKANTFADNIFNMIDQIYTIAKSKLVSFVMFNIFDVNILLQLFDANYETVLDFIL